MASKEAMDLAQAVIDLLGCRAELDEAEESMSRTFGDFDPSTLYQEEQEAYEEAAEKLYALVHPRRH